MVGQTSSNPGITLPSPLGIIEVIHATSIDYALPLNRALRQKRLRLTREPISFDDFNRSSQPHDDALIVASRIGGFLIKRVLIDQWCKAEIMYPDPYKGLGLKPEDLMKYDKPLVGFDWKVVVPQRQISLPVMTEGKEVMVNFIVFNAFYPYEAILGWPWIHAMGVVPSNLHMKVKFPIEDELPWSGGINELHGSAQWP